ncbi:tape measure protein [Synechococcus phage DSL-LC07]|nr:tape measure protein [Synechococcus phage DSL-LC07]
MDQVSYRGYARSIGFDPIKAPTEGLARMQERDNRIIRGMEDNRREIKQVRDEYGAGLERKLSIEARDRDQNYQWERKLAEKRQEAIGKNAQTLIQSELQRGKNAEATFESLAKFSTTLSEGLTEYRKAKEESDMMAGYMEVATGGLSPERQQTVAGAETLLKQSGEAQDQIAEGFQARGLDPVVVTSLLSGNKARDYGRLKAHMEIISAEFPAYAQSKLDEMGAVTAPDRTAAMQSIFGDFLKENGVFGLSADFMAPALMKMRGTYNSFIEAARKSDVVNKSATMRDDALSGMSRIKTGESLTEAFRTAARSYKEDGVTPVGNADAKAAIFKELADTTRYSDADVERMLKEAQTDQGSWYDRFPRDVDDLRNARMKDQEAEFQLIDAQERRELKRQEDQLLDWVSNNNPNEETLTSIIKEAKTKGINTDRLQAHLAFTTEQQNADFWTKQFREQYEQGTLTAEDVDQPGVPIEVRETWRTRAQQLDQQRSDSGIKQETIKAELTDALKQNLIGDSTSRSAHYSLRGASDYALKLYNQKFKQYAKTMEPSVAANKARLDVLTAIENKKGAFSVIGSSEAATGKTQAFYAAFTPGKHPGAPATINVITTSEVIKKVRANNNVINTEVLASPALLKDINNRIASGKPISIPQIYTDLSRAMPGMTPTQILNAQLGAAGLTQRVRPGFRDQLNQINDPVLRRILDQPLTQDRLNTAIIGSGNAPATVRTGNSGYADVQALGTASGFKFPQVMAAMWALESGWGKYTSGKNNVFNIKARTGQGTMKNGSYWRDYASPLESAKDFMNLMTDPRYSPGLAKAKTPRQAIEAIAAGGYAGGEAAYPSKIIRVMQQMGVNVDQPYTPAATPARNQAFMRPTLAYITDNIGPTSTGPHLDVKQQDNPNTPQNEFAREFAAKALDNFVLVEDPQFGRVPLSRIPVTDTFAGHVARGSHGIDYGTAKGSKVFLQNGARIVSKSRTQHGDKLVIQLPDGRRFSFLHGRTL